VDTANGARRGADFVAAVGGVDFAAAEGDGRSTGLGEGAAGAALVRGSGRGLGNGTAALLSANSAAMKIPASTPAP
jgi:hypothetical protein